LTERALMHDISRGRVGLRLDSSLSPPRTLSPISDVVALFRPPRQDFKGMQLKEIKNGRLAMLAIGGVVHHYFITGKGPVELITNFQIGA
jgi:hypothetical protein